jgi:membrane-bound inhibitor of C-type lysozyme
VEAALLPMTFRLFALVVALATAPAAAQAPAPPKTIEARFACAGGKSIDATFVNTGGGSVKLALSDGRSLTLPQTMSGSGARYANKGETIVFWNKGDTAFIEEGDKVTYQDCATKR